MLTGSWGKKALKEAKKVGGVNAATMADGGLRACRRARR